MNPAAEAVLDALNRGPASGTELAARLGKNPKAVQATLRSLRKQGQVQKRGKTRDAIWALNGTPIEDRNSVMRVRELAWELRTFSLQDMVQRLPDLSHETVRKAIQVWEVRGMLRSYRVGHQKRYECKRPKPPARFSRPRRKPPEAEFIARRGKGRPVAGTGRQERPTNREVGVLLEEVTAAGGEIQRRTRHWAVLFGGQVIGTVPNTPSDHRSLLNARAALRRAGLPLGEPPRGGLYSSNQPEPTQGGQP